MPEHAGQVLSRRWSLGAIAQATGPGRPKAAYDMYRSHLERLRQGDRAEIFDRLRRELIGDAPPDPGARL